MTFSELDKFTDLLARSKAAWLDRVLLNLTESAESPTKAYDLVLKKTGKRKKAKAARLLAVAMRDFNPDIVGAAVRFLKVRKDWQRLRTILFRPD